MEKEVLEIAALEPVVTLSVEMINNFHRIFV